MEIEKFEPEMQSPNAGVCLDSNCVRVTLPLIRLQTSAQRQSHRSPPVLKQSRPQHCQ